jgi:FG-GAP repeat
MPTTTQPPAVRRASVTQRRPPDEYDDPWPPRMPPSVLRYAPPPDTVPQPRRRGLWYVLVPIFCICLGATLAALIPPALQQWRDNTTYGFPRTYHITSAVGHGDPHSPSSHFVAVNLGGILEVIELPGGDPARYPPQLYRLATLTGSGADLVAVTVGFADVNGDGKPDLIASYGGTETILFNNGKTFVSKL